MNPSELPILLSIDRRVTQLVDGLGLGNLILPDVFRPPYSQTLRHPCWSSVPGFSWETSLYSNSLEIRLRTDDGYLMHVWRNRVDFRPAKDCPGTAEWAKEQERA